MIKTAGGSGTNNISRIGYGNYPVNTGDWTILVSFKYPVAPANYIAILNLFSGAADYTSPYLFLGSAPSTGNCILEIFDGVTDTISTAVAITNNAQNWAAVTNHNHVQTFIVNGVVIGTLNFNLDAIVWSKLYLLGDGSAANANAVSVAYLFAWSSIKSLTELIVQAASIIPTNTVNLLFNNPFQTSTDLTSHNNTLNHLTATGTVTTDLVDPLLSVVAAPPANVNPNAATLIDLNSAYFQDTLTAGAATSTWYKAVVPIGDRVWGASAFSSLAGYQPRIIVYTSLANALIDSQFVNSSFSKPVQFPVNAGDTMYFQAQRNGALTPATVQISILRGLTLEVPVGSICIPDDSEPFSLAFLDAVVTGYPINWVNGFSNGEQGVIFPTGEMVQGDSVALDTRFYDATFNLVAEPTFPTTGYVRVGNSANFAYVAFQSTGIFRQLTKSGVLQPTIYDTPNTIFGLSANNDDTIVYYINGGIVSRWDIVNNVALSDLAAAVASYSLFQTVVALPGGNIVANYSRSGVNYFIRVYDPSGTIVTTFGPIADGRTCDYLCTDINPDRYWSWTQNSTTSRFKRISAVDSSVSVDINNVDLYESGIYQGAPNNTPVRFGHSNSCPLWITRIALFTTTVIKAGLYHIIPSASEAGSIKTNDTEWIDASAGTSDVHPIPNPFVEHYLAGDE